VAAGAEFHEARVWGRGAPHQVGQVGSRATMGWGERGLLGHMEGQAGLDERGWGEAFPFYYFSLPFYSYSNLNIVFESKIQLYVMSLN
jgi:hypothetical protein